MTLVKERKHFNSSHKLAVLIYTSHLEPGYDPGDPSYPVPAVEFETFPDAEALKVWVELYRDKKNFQILGIHPMSFKTEVKITLE